MHRAEPAMRFMPVTQWVYVGGAAGQQHAVQRVQRRLYIRLLGDEREMNRHTARRLHRFAIGARQIETLRL
jgi:hypothetical protein